MARYVHGDVPRHAHQGQRVVEYQQALQTVSDPLLGWTTIENRSYYVRQFRDMKGAIPFDTLKTGSADGLRADPGSSARQGTCADERCIDDCWLCRSVEAPG